MITILAVAGAAAELTPAFAQHPSVEVLAADDIEEALEKLARNRRVDAVLLLGAGEVASVAEAILEEDPGSPPLYAPARAGVIPRVASLPDASPVALVEALARLLQPED